MKAVKRTALFLGLLALAGPLQALDFEWGDLSGGWHNKLSMGATWRMEPIDYDLIGKVSVPGQESICDADIAAGRPLAGCTFNPVDLRNARGSYFLNGDNGNRSFEKGDLVAAAAKLRSDLFLEWGDFSLSALGFAVFDPVNDDALIVNTNNFTNNGYQPATVPRSLESRRQLGSELELEAVNVSWVGEWLNRDLSVTVGSQRLAWGESLTIVAHSLNNINPPDLVRVNTPGFEPEELFDPVGLVNIGIGLTENSSLGLVYQYDWQPVRTPPFGSFFSTVDVVGAGADYLLLGLGNNREDPHNLGDRGFQAPIDAAAYGRGCLFDDTDPNGSNNQGAHRGDLNNPLESPLAFTAGRAVCHVNDLTPKESGQFGLNWGYYAEWLNDTQFNLYYMNYHSRFPLLSLYATQDPPAVTTALPPGLLPPGLPLPDVASLTRVLGALKVVDTMRYTLAYPEDIELWGLSFNTVVGDLSVSGEFAYRPNQPLQIYGVDLNFFGLANAFDSLRCDAGPSLIEEYRNGPRGDACDSPPPAAGEFIPGWERHQVAQGVLGIINAESNNPFGADRWLQVLEIGFTKVIDMPAADEYRLQGVGQQTHPSIGRDEVDADGNGARDVAAGGTNLGLDIDVIAMQNPTRQRGGFPTAFSWGYHLINVLEYKNLFWGVNTQAVMVWFHDVNGYSPGPGQNFVKGRKRATLLGRFDYGNWGASAGYTWRFGGGEFNDVRDRDVLSFSMSYRF
jgi:hypothetical protein